VVSVQVQFNGTEEVVEYKLIPNDWYEAEITNLKEKISGAGNEMLEVEFTVVSGQCKNSKVWTHLVPVGKGLYGIRRFVEACGVEWSKDNPTVIDESYIGRFIKIEVTTDIWNEKEKNKIKFGGFERLEGYADEIAGGRPF
jgi:hypothetical protein